MTTVRVATYNLYLGADLSVLFGVDEPDRLTAAVQRVLAQLERTRSAERALAVAALLARSRPDLVGLQEVTRWTVTDTAAEGQPGEETVLADVVGTILDALAAAGCAYDVVAVNENFSGALPVSASRSVGVVGANATLVRRDPDIEVVGEHSATYRHRHVVAAGPEGAVLPVLRSWGRVDVRVAGRPLRFVTTHTEAYDGPVRDAQRDEVLAAHSDRSTPVVLVGDLNTTPSHVGVPAPWVDAWTRGDGDGATWGQDGDLSNERSRLVERIDYVWVRDLTVRSAHRVGHRQEDRTVPHHLWPSDHAGVVAELAW